MRQGDIFEDKTAMATLDTVESLYPGLPLSKDGSEIEMNIQRLKQMEMDK